MLLRARRGVRHVLTIRFYSCRFPLWESPMSVFYRILVAMDRATSFALGRPCAIQDEE